MGQHRDSGIESGYLTVKPEHLSEKIGLAQIDSDSHENSLYHDTAQLVSILSML